MNRISLHSWKVYGVILASVGVLLTACQSALPATSTPVTNGNQVGTMVSGTLTAFPTSTSASTLTPAQQAYTNPDYGFAFEYLLGWDLTETVVPEGTKLTGRSMGRFDMAGGGLLVDLARGSDWILEVAANKTSIDPCTGGMGPVPNDSTYQPLQVLGRSAARLRAEDGIAWNPPEQRQLSTLPVMFYMLAGECAQAWPDGTIPAGDAVFFWNFTDPQTSLSLSLTYYSNQFTAENLQNRTIDYAVLHEMDQIVQSLRLVPAK